MKRIKRITILGLSIFMAIILMHGYAFAAESQTIVGTVTENYEITASDGTVYYIVENEKGDQVAQLIGKKVSVSGIVKEYQDMTKEISITSYEILEESDEKDEGAGDEFE